jgi:MFS family permease
MAMASAGPVRFYGWRIVAVAFLAQGLSTAATVYLYGMFLKPLTTEFGASRMVAGLGLSAMYAVQALISPSLGRALDRHSIRAIMISGTLGMCAGLVLLSTVGALWQAGLVYALLVGVGSAMAGPLSGATLVSNWFVRSRGRALGLAALGVSFCGFALPPIAAALIAALGWRSACLALGLGIAAILVPALAIVVVSRPEERGWTPDGVPAESVPRAASDATAPVPWTTGALLRDRNFRAIVAAIALIAGATVAMLTHIVAFATDQGIEAQRASLLISVVAGFSMLGKVGFGALIDRLDERITFYLMVGVQTAGWLILLFASGLSGLLCATALFGFGAGGNLPISGGVVAAVFGRESFGRVMGLMTPFMLLFTVVTPPLVGHVYDRSGSYDLAFRLLALGTIAAAVPVAFLRIDRARAADRT